VVDRLEAAGLLARRPDAGDRRVHRLALTAKGRALRAPLDAAMDAAMDALNAEIAAGVGGAREAAALWEALRRLGGVET
jgi:MarR family transcriptional regulator, organic hydroperoxide resistance regulator